MDEIGERLCARGSLMEIGSLSAESVRRNHTLGLELFITHGTKKLYLTQRCHGSSLPSLWNLSGNT
jgi:hypothetical protein